MVDVGLTQAIVQRLNRLYRKRAKPHGKADHYYRGIRMTRTFLNRLFFLFCWFFLLFIVVAFFFVPDLFKDEPLAKVLLLKAGWLLMAGCVLLGPFGMLRDYAVVTDEGLIKPKLFGGELHVAWSDIASVKVDGDSNQVCFITGDQRKCKIDLGYDGWRDLMEAASKRMNQSLFYQLAVLLQNIDLKRPRLAKKKVSKT